MRRATPIVLTDEQREQLQRLSRGRRVSVRLAQRASIVLLAAGGLENKQIGQRLNITRQTAGRWRDRYAAHGLTGIEKDAPRPGRKPTITARQRAAVVRKTLHQTPEGQTHWSRSTMARATGLSDSTIGRIWSRRSSCPTTRSSWRSSTTSLGSASRPRSTRSCCRAMRRVRSRRSTARSRACRSSPGVAGR